MALVPALDLRAGDPRDRDDVLPVPSNIDAEQALLGAILFDNAAYERIGDLLRPTDFYDSFHARLFAAMEEHIRNGQLAEPIVLMERFRRDVAFEEMGGLRYLADLVDRAPPALNALDYAKVIHDLALRRELMRLGTEMVQRAARDRETTARDQIEEVERNLFQASVTQTTSGLTEFADVLVSSIEMAAAAYTRDGALAGLSTGLIDLDRKLGGLAPEHLIILAARPSMGKSSLALNMAFSVARAYVPELQSDGARKTAAGGVVAFFSLEMSAEDLGLRILSEVSGVSSDRIRKGEVDASEFGRVRDAAVEIQRAPLYVDTTSAISLATLTLRARRLKRTVGLDLVVVDYLQLMSIDSGRYMAPTERVSAITAGLKALAKDLGVPVVALAQLSRGVEQRDDKRPQLSDLRDSGSIEQDADDVLFIYREAYYLERTQPKEGTAEHLTWEEALDKARYRADIIIGKARHGPIGSVRLAFNPVLTKFSNLAREGHFESSPAP